jgi:putative toxin-antitoxin system antitoxin component (TIGR02293 family)
MTANANKQSVCNTANNSNNYNPSSKLVFATDLFYTYNKIVANMSDTTGATRPFNTKASVAKASEISKGQKKWVLVSEGKTYVWTNKMERVGIIRQGIPYDAIETISKRLNRPVKSVLLIVGMPQTTYNKKKSEHSLLDSRDSELIVLITELIDYGIEVFNHEEEKFQRWLKKPNVSLGGNTPESLLDTITGIDEVQFCLNRIEYGNFA